MAELKLKIDKKTEAAIRKKFGKENWHCEHKHGSGGALYGLGFLGALYYYVTTAPDLWAGIVGVVKAIFWPALMVYELMKYLGM